MNSQVIMRGHVTPDSTVTIHTDPVKMSNLIVAMIESTCIMTLG